MQPEQRKVEKRGNILLPEVARQVHDAFFAFEKDGRQIEREWHIGRRTLEAALRQHHNHRRNEGVRLLAMPSRERAA